jgi:hypothetical protein
MRGSKFTGTRSCSSAYMQVIASRSRVNVRHIAAAPASSVSKPLADDGSGLTALAGLRCWCGLLERPRHPNLLALRGSHDAAVGLPLLGNGAAVRRERPVRHAVPWAGRSLRDAAWSRFLAVRGLDLPGPPKARRCFLPIVVAGSCFRVPDRHCTRGGTVPSVRGRRAACPNDSRGGRPARVAMTDGGMPASATHAC